MVLLKVNRVGNNANRVRMRLAKITRRYVGRQWRSGIEILMEMMEEDFSFVWLETFFFVSKLLPQPLAYVYVVF